MDKFRMLFQHFQSSSESVMNGVCLVLAVVTVKLYSSFDFNCPCLARYNTLYGLGLLFTPPLVLFLCSLLANRQSVVMVEEWRRPAGHRRKDPGIIRCAVPLPPRGLWALSGPTHTCTGTVRGTPNSDLPPWAFSGSPLAQKLSGTPQTLPVPHGHYQAPHPHKHC